MKEGQAEEDINQSINRTNNAVDLLTMDMLKGK